MEICLTNNMQSASSKYFFLFKVLGPILIRQSKTFLIIKHIYSIRLAKAKQQPSDEGLINSIKILKLFRSVITNIL
jgi:hypothetical protein